MTISSKIFEALTGAIKLNDTITRLAEDVKELAKEVKEIDRRLIRLEAFVEIADKQRKLARHD
jgi:ATP-dependent protease HslVU (ClpYQ) peptidase subunit